MKVSSFVALLLSAAPAIADLPDRAHDPRPTPHSSVCELKCDVRFMQWYDDCLAKGETDCVAKARKLTGCSDFTCSYNCGYTAPGCVNPPESANVATPSSVSESCTGKSTSTATVYITLSRPTLDEGAIAAAAETAMDRKDVQDLPTVFVTVTGTCSAAPSTKTTRPSMNSSTNGTLAVTSFASFLNATSSSISSAPHGNITSRSASSLSFMFFDLSGTAVATHYSSNAKVVLDTTNVVPPASLSDTKTSDTTNIVPTAAFGTTSGTIKADARIGTSAQLSTNPLSLDSPTAPIEKRDRTYHPQPTIIETVSVGAPLIITLVASSTMDTSVPSYASVISDLMNTMTLESTMTLSPVSATIAAPANIGAEPLPAPFILTGTPIATHTIDPLNLKIYTQVAVLNTDYNIAWDVQGEGVLTPTVFTTTVWQSPISRSNTIFIGTATTTYIEGILTDTSAAPNITYMTMATTRSKGGITPFSATTVTTIGAGVRRFEAVAPILFAVSAVVHVVVLIVL